MNARCTYMHITFPYEHLRKLSHWRGVEVAAPDCGGASARGCVHVCASATCSLRGGSVSLLDTRAAALLDGESSRLALQWAASQRWQRLLLAMWVARRGSVGVPCVVVASAVAIPWFKSGGLAWVLPSPLVGWVDNLESTGDYCVCLSESYALWHW